MQNERQQVGSLLHPLYETKTNEALPAMRKIILFISALLFLCTLASARHIKGGWVQYEYVGAGTTANTSEYKITINVFRSCADNGPMPSAIGIYDATTNASVKIISGTNYTLAGSPTKSTFDPCLSNPPTICYQIYTYSTTVTLPDNVNGYTIAAQDANRITGIINITNSSSTGISFTGSIPGIINGVDYHINSSPFFQFKDTAIVCYGSKFTYQFTATDPDAGDSLTYSFGNGINGSQTLTSPPYSPLTYTSGFSGNAPLGPLVTIDPSSGLISGTAPLTTGEYVIAVYVNEWRNGVLFNSTRKELQINVANCSLSAATLKPVYLNCNTFDFAFQNESASSNITSYQWDFGVPGITTDVSTNPTPNYTYPDSGSYTVKLIVRNSLGCTDSAKGIAKVYPGFNPSFTVTGSCFQSPFQFTDNSLIKYGTGSWVWDLGDPNSTNDTSTLKNPSYTYSTPGNVTVTMNVSSSVGCSGSVSKVVTLNNKPFIALGFTDTLICSIDSLPLKAQSSGTVFRWSPNYKISNVNIANPIVYPKDTTTYTVTVTDQGCIDSAKVKVNVLQFITVKLGLDSGICKTDSFTLRPVSDALSYVWRESVNGNSLSSYTTKYPRAAPLVTTTYFVTANLGYCQDSAKVKINVSPYPVANLGNDTAICFGSRIQLKAAISGSYFSWSPTSSLINANTLNPIAGPSKSTSYIFTASDTLYCPKLVSDTIFVKVIQPFTVNAGKDTSASVGQPLQLQVTGGDPSYAYVWTPASFLDNAAIANPVATITSAGIDSIKYLVRVTTPEGCSSSDDIIVRVFKNGPEIYVPSGFTPNGDGLNDILRPALIGIEKFEFFNVYNRWGQLIFHTTTKNAGWDGTINGTAQPSGAYVYMAQGVDNKGNVIFRKGTSVLIR